MRTIINVKSCIYIVKGQAIIYLGQILYWSTIEKLAKDRQGWKDFIAALCATQA